MNTAEPAKWRGGIRRKHIQEPTKWRESFFMIISHVFAYNTGVDALLENFVMSDGAARQEAGFCACPPFLRRMYLLGKARAAREALRQEKTAERGRANQAAQKTFLFEFEAEEPGKDQFRWRRHLKEALSSAEQEEAKAAWEHAESEEQRRMEEMPLTDDVEALMTAMRKQRSYILKDLKWDHWLLHDAVLHMRATHQFTRPS